VGGFRVVCVGCGDVLLVSLRRVAVGAVVKGLGYVVGYHIHIADYVYCSYVVR